MDKKKILVVDDEKNISESLSLMLGARGFDVITASKPTLIYKINCLITKD